MMVMSAAEDARVRMLIVRYLRRVESSGVLTRADLDAGAEVDGRRISVVSRRGIFKPAQMRWLLSISTVHPRPNARVWYDDQTIVHSQIEAGDEEINYSFQGRDPAAFDNQLLLEAMRERVPIIYFLGVAPARYTAHFPTFVVDWDPRELRAKIAFGTASQAVREEQSPFDIDRRYAVREVQQRLHQARFREAVLTAYGQRCALTGLPEPKLLDAAHIVGDKDEEMGMPVVPNGLPLSKVHHAAYDANLIGIDPDYRIHISEKLLSIHDGPMLEEAIKKIDGRLIRLPAREVDYPDRNRLAVRFEQFEAMR
jgi:putative restriction endonuclease